MNILYLRKFFKEYYMKKQGDLHSDFKTVSNLSGTHILPPWVQSKDFSTYTFLPEYRAKISAHIHVPGVWVPLKPLKSPLKWKVLCRDPHETPDTPLICRGPEGPKICKICTVNLKKMFYLPGWCIAISLTFGRDPPALCQAAPAAGFSSPVADVHGCCCWPCGFLKKSQIFLKQFLSFF